MPIVKICNDNKYVSLFEDDNVRIWAKTALYKSSINNEEYDIVTDIAITKNEELFYKEHNLYFPINQNGLVSIVDYVDKITAYLKDADKNNIAEYWQKLFLNDLLINKNTVKIEVFYKRYIREQKQNVDMKEAEQTRNQIDQLKDQIVSKYNNSGYVVLHDIYNLIILKDATTEIHRQNDVSFMDSILKMIEEDHKLIKKHLHKHMRLNWNKDDILILNELIQFSI